jgi:aminomethyltransferase
MQTTPLHALHLALGAKMMPFAGYDMPVNYPAGILAEHRHCRQSAALFDVSHMGQITVSGTDAALALETLIPVDIVDLYAGQQRYGFFTSASGGILDDLMLTQRQEDIFMVVNASCVGTDLQHLRSHIGQRCTITHHPEWALLALQGPQAVVALVQLNPAVAQLSFMTGAALNLAGVPCFITRSGYTGEDGFEISVTADRAEHLARTLLEIPEVQMAGLGARDTLRLEAGLCLHGNDISSTTTPVEAGLAWAIQKVRRPNGTRYAGYLGSEVIDQQLAHGMRHKRTGLIGLERTPVRPGATVHDAHGKLLGKVTSGTMSPSLNVPIAMAYIEANHALPNLQVYAQVRGKPIAMRVNTLPFTPHRYFRKPTLTTRN